MIQIMITFLKFEDIAIGFLMENTFPVVTCRSIVFVTEVCVVILALLRTS